MRCLLVFALVALTACGQPTVAPADLILSQATIHINVAAQPLAEAVAVRDGRIVAVGSLTELQPFIGPATRQLPLGGAYVYPGFADAHVHLAGVGERELTLNLAGSENLTALQARLAERVAQADPGEWITGRGWIETHWQPPVFPTRDDLDVVAPDNPVFIERADGHGAVANSLALNIAGITPDTPAPFGGDILRDAQGRATGMLLDKAQQLVTAHIPLPSAAQQLEYLATGAQTYAALGWTQAQIAGNDLAQVAQIRELYQQGRIGIRIYDAVRGPSADAWRLIRDRASLARDGEFDGRFTLRTIKVSIDGALGSRGAAMLEPYADAATSGYLTWKAEEVVPLYQAALEAGIQIETHAIGDRANRQVLDWYEQVFNAVPASKRAVAEPRWRIEHAQILSAADVPRFAALGVIPSMQPSHAIDDLFFATRRIGVEQLAHAYAWRELLDSGVIIPCGTDAPVEKGDPRIEFYAAITRRALNGYQGEGWHPEQVMTRTEALKCLTLWPAYAAFEEDVRGTIEPGKYADFTVLDTDLLHAEPTAILAARVLYTIVGGDIVYPAQ